MRIHEYVLAVLIISFVVLSGTLLVADVGTQYGVDNSAVNDKFGSVYDKVNETYTIAEEINDDVLNAEISETSAWESMIIGSYSAIRLVGNSFQILGDMISDVAIELGIPSFVIQFAITALMIMIIFTVIYLVMKIKG